MVVLPDGEKNFEDTFIHFHMIHEGDGRTHTDRQTPHDDIGRAYAWHRATKTLQVLSLLKVYSSQKNELAKTILAV